MPGLPNYDNSPTSTSNTRRDKRVDVWAGEGCGSQGIKKGREKTQAPSAGVRSSYFLFRFARGGSPTGVSILVAATMCEDSMDLGGSGNEGSSSATSDVLLRPSPARACSVDTLIESVPGPMAELDPETADRGTDDILSSMTASTSVAPTSLSCAFVKAVKK